MERTRYEKLLESAIETLFMSFEKTELYPFILQKVARLCYELVMNHPFVDGNKPIAVHAMLIFLAFNKVEQEYTQGQLVQIVLNIAKGKSNTSDLFKWLQEDQK